MPRECAYHASIAVPSSGSANETSTPSHASMSARSPETIVSSLLRAAAEVAADDYRFADLLANERNVPSELRSEIANLYQPRSLSGR